MDTDPIDLNETKLKLPRLKRSTPKDPPDSISQIENLNIESKRGKKGTKEENVQKC